MPPRKKPTITSEPSSIFAVVGSDEAETKRRAIELAGELTPEQGLEFGVDTIDGMTDNADQAVLRIRQVKEAIQTLPFFGRDKLVWLKNANFLSDTGPGRSAAVQEALEDLKEFLARGLPNGVRFLLSAWRRCLRMVTTNMQLKRIDRLLRWTASSEFTVDWPGPAASGAFPMSDFSPKIYNRFNLSGVVVCEFIHGRSLLKLLSLATTGLKCQDLLDLLVIRQKQTRNEDSPGRSVFHTFAPQTPRHKASGEVASSYLQFRCLNESLSVCGICFKK